MEPRERRTLVFIRLAMLASAVLAAGLALWLRARTRSTPDTVRVLQYAFIAQAVFAFAVMVWLRRAIAQPKHEARRVPFTIVSWAVAESAAVLGAVVFMLGADMWYLVSGLFLFYLSSRTHPIPT